MSALDVTGALPAPLGARLGRYAARPGVELRPVPVLPAPPLAEAEIIAAAGGLVPPPVPPGLTRLADLGPRRPWVDGVAWLDFETVEFYRTGEAAFASIGTFFRDPEFPPSARITLAEAPAGGGNLVTCRAQGIAVGPSFPGWFNVEGPGVDTSFVDHGSPTTFTVFVPPGGAGPVEITIRTDADRIRLWALIDCTITQI